MILIDFSNVAIRAITGGTKDSHIYYPTTEQLNQHRIYNKLRFYNHKFAKKYGDIVICLEGKNNWRKEAFPLYKFKRKKAKDSSYIDWDHLYKVMDATIEALIQYFPYKVLRYDMSEADDIIGTLAKYVNEPNIIVSPDKDFNQLIDLHNVEQFDTQTETICKLEGGAHKFLLDHILMGDTGDSVPNILSPDDIFTQEGKRQKSITQPYKDNFTARLRANELTEEEIKNFARNDKLINLNSIPKNIKLGILDLYTNYEIIGCRQTLLTHLIKEKYVGLIDVINEF